jgi:hypothetical protein
MRFSPEILVSSSRSWRYVCCREKKHPPDRDNSLGKNPPCLVEAAGSTYAFGADSLRPMYRLRRGGQYWPRRLSSILTRRLTDQYAFIHDHWHDRLGWFGNCNERPRISSELRNDVPLRHITKISFSAVKRSSQTQNGGSAFDQSMGARRAGQNIGDISKPSIVLGSNT